jgi:hypothetical protein
MFKQALTSKRPRLSTVTYFQKNIAFLSVICCLKLMKRHLDICSSIANQTDAEENEDERYKKLNIIR